MNSRDITVWLDSRWCDALEAEYGMPIEDIVDDQLDELINKLPEHEYERISREIYQEHIEQEQETEAARKFSAFHIVDHGEHSFVQVDRSIEALDAARLLRSYLRQEPAADHFSQFLHAAVPITADQFEDLVHERMENTGRVTGAFDLDFDKEQFSALHIMDGWKTYKMKDVSTAIFHADRKEYISRNARWERFTDKLMGKEISYEPEQYGVKYIEGEQRLQPQEIDVEGEVMWRHNQLEFYVPTNFDVDKVLGTEVATAPRTSYVNVYAYYDLETEAVRDDLTIVLCHEDVSAEEFKYRLTPEEKELFRQKMNEHCIKCGADLTQCREEYLQEETEAQARQSAGPVMQM